MLSLEETGVGCGHTLLAASPAPMAQGGRTLVYTQFQQLTTLCMSCFHAVLSDFYMALIPVVPVNSLKIEPRSLASSITLQPGVL